MIHMVPPPGFIPDLLGVGCFLEAEGHLLLLKRRDDLDIEPGKLGVPGGRVKRCESARMAMLRELEEETGIFLVSSQRLVSLSTLHVVYPELQFRYHLFGLKLERKPEVILNLAEHTDLWWGSPKDALGMDLMRDEDDCIRMFFQV